MISAFRPRRQVSRVLRERLYLRSTGTCERPGCGATITIDTFHVSHLRPHVSGGALVEENLAAWCSRCNLTNGRLEAGDTRLVPREWQLEALDPVVQRIIADGAATVSAAPGAGKTVFAGLVYEFYMRPMSSIASSSWRLGARSSTSGRRRCGRPATSNSSHTRK